MAKAKSCKSCVFYWRDGTGYSDWTWMDTDQRCALDKHPEWPASESESTGKAEERMQYAEKCDSFEDASYDGKEPVLISPDGELRGGDNRAAKMIRRLSK